MLRRRVCVRERERKKEREGANERERQGPREWLQLSSPATLPNLLLIQYLIYYLQVAVGAGRLECCKASYVKRMLTYADVC